VGDPWREPRPWRRHWARSLWHRSQRSASRRQRLARCSSQDVTR
jgi:hypothetical protein